MQALKVELERTQIVKEKFKTATIRVRKECDELRDVNTATAATLEPETSFEGLYGAATSNSSSKGLKGTSRESNV